MCWSAETDLGMGAAITAVGLAAVGTVAVRGRPRDLPMALLPVVLGVHQLVEAVVWWGTEGAVSAGTARLAREVWALIAFPLLPAFVPLAVLAAGVPGRRRRDLLGPALFTALGLVVCGVLAYAVASGPVKAEVHGHTVRYAIGVPAAPLVIGGYLVACLGPLLCSRDRALRLLGIVCAVGALGCAVLWFSAFASTWCAVAAAASVLVLWWAWRRPEVPGPLGGRAGTA